MYPVIYQLAQSLEKEFDLIPEERKETLLKLSAYIKQQNLAKKPSYLVYICTHNSRRSHFGQVAAAVAAEYYEQYNVQSFSGGTEVTAFNPNAIDALNSLGFVVEAQDDDLSNPLYQVNFGNGLYANCFSKLYNSEANPPSNFVAVMTCSDAEKNCPFIPNVDLRIAVTYEDPKKSDGTPEQEATYMARFKQIARETFFVFANI